MQVNNLIVVSDRLDSDATLQVSGMFRDSQDLMRPLSELSRHSVGSHGRDENGRNP